MYQIYANDTLIYDSTLHDYVITKGSITKEVNKSGSFTFSMYQDNPYYDRIEKLKTIITVYKYDLIIFRGRVITEQVDFYNNKTFTCEGELSFFLDSIQRPYTFTGSPEDLFAQFVNNHNAQVGEDKQFILGEVTITDPNDYIYRSNDKYEDTLTNIDKHLIDHNGGYLDVSRNSEGKPVISWLEDYPYMSDQSIEFGKNLLDFSKTNSTEEIATAIIPLGAKQDNEDKTRLTITEVNNGLDYIYDEEAVKKYGWITRVETWDDVTIASNLLDKAKTYLNELINQNITIELTAVDLSTMDKNIDMFKVGDYIQIISEPHNLDDMFLLKKQTIDILNPDKDKITLGYNYSTFTDTTIANKSETSTIIKTVETIESNYVTNTIVTEEVNNLKSLIDQNSSSISFEVLADYASNDQVTEATSTVYEQLNNSFEFGFNQLTSKIDENDAESRREFELIRKYIRFIDGRIYIGESGNELVLRIENDKIVFIDANREVAYLSNQKLYITDAEILGSLRIGNFSYLPRDNGNLSFKKVGGV